MLRMTCCLSDHSALLLRMEGQGRNLWVLLANAPGSSHNQPKRGHCSPVFSLFVSVGAKATGKGAFSDLPQKSDHTLSSPHPTSL